MEKSYLIPTELTSINQMKKKKWKKWDFLSNVLFFFAEYKAWLPGCEGWKVSDGVMQWKLTEWQLNWPLAMPSIKNFIFLSII